MIGTQVLTTKDKTSLNINKIISLTLENNFSNYVHQFEEDHHESGLAEVSLTRSEDYSLTHSLLEKKENQEEDQSFTLDYWPSRDKISISSPWFYTGLVHDEGLTALLWNNTIKAVGKRNNVKCDLSSSESYNPLHFTTEFKDIQKLADTKILDVKIKNYVTDVMTAYQEMQRAPEVLAKLIVSNL